VENALLSRRCGGALKALIGKLVEQPGLSGCVRLYFLRDERPGGFGPDLLHAVLTQEGTDGICFATVRCMCGAIENPYNPARSEAPRQGWCSEGPLT